MIRSDPTVHGNTIEDQMIKFSHLKRFNGELPSGNLVHVAIKNGPVELVSFPINSMVLFHSYVNVYQRAVGIAGDLVDYSVMRERFGSRQSFLTT